jgi:hypothetical protein
MYLPTLPAVFWLAIYNTTHPPVKETAITALRKFDLTPCVVSDSTLPSPGFFAKRPQTECFISEGDDWTFNMPVCTWCRKVTEEGYLDRFNKCREQNCGRDDFCELRVASERLLVLR